MFARVSEEKTMFAIFFPKSTRTRMNLSDHFYYSLLNEFLEHRTGLGARGNSRTAVCSGTSSMIYRSAIHHKLPHCLPSLSERMS